MGGGVSTGAEGTGGRYPSFAAMQEQIVGGDPEEEAINCPDGADGSVLDVFQDRGWAGEVRKGSKERGRRKLIRVCPPELGDPGLETDFYEGDREAERSRN